MNKFLFKVLLGTFIFCIILISQNFSVYSMGDFPEGPLCDNSEVCNSSNELVLTSVSYDVNWEKAKVESKKDIIPSKAATILFGFCSGLFFSTLVLTLVFMYPNKQVNIPEETTVTGKEVQRWQIKEHQSKPETKVTIDDTKKWIELASQSDNQKDRFNYYKLAAESCEEKGNYGESAIYWELCGKIILEVEGLCTQAAEYFKKAGFNYDTSKNYSLSIECFNKSSDIYKKIGTNNDLSQLYYRIANLYESKTKDLSIIRNNYLKIAEHAPDGYKEIFQGFAYRLEHDSVNTKMHLENALNCFNIGLKELGKFPENNEYVKLFFSLIKNRNKSY